MAGGMHERDKHLLPASPVLAHIVLHGRVATRIAVLGPQALIDPLGRVTLLGRRRTVRLQKAIDNRRERIEAWGGPRAWCAGIRAAPRRPASCARCCDEGRSGAPPRAGSGPQSGRHGEPIHKAPPRTSSPSPTRCARASRRQCRGTVLNRRSRTTRPPHWHTLPVPLSTRSRQRVYWPSDSEEAGAVASIWPGLSCENTTHGRGILSSPSSKQG